MFRANVLILTAVFSVLVAPVSSQAGVVVPEGLQPGDPYHLAFVTDGARDALSSDIADYNLFVNNQAAMNSALTGTDMGVEWFAIGSTATVNARDNAVVGAGVPVYLLNGTTKVVDGFADMWDGTLDAPINLNQFTATISTSVWTGSTISGGSDATRFLGSGGLIILGASSASSGSWISNIALLGTSPHRMYALSEQLPEPATGSLLLIACGALAWGRRRRRPAGQSSG